jgi:hypothetical protein
MIITQARFKYDYVCDEIEFTFDVKNTHKNIIIMHAMRCSKSFKNFNWLRGVSIWEEINFKSEGHHFNALKPNFRHLFNILSQI